MQDMCSLAVQLAQVLAVLAVAQTGRVRADLIAQASASTAASASVDCSTDASFEASGSCLWIGDTCSNCEAGCIVNARDATFAASAELALARDMSCYTLSFAFAESTTPALTGCPSNAAVKAKAEVVAGLRVKAGANQVNGARFTTLHAWIRCLTSAATTETRACSLRLLNNATILHNMRALLVGNIAIGLQVLIDVVDALESTEALSKHFEDNCEDVEVSQIEGVSKTGKLCANKNGATLRALECAPQTAHACS